MTYKVFKQDNNPISFGIGPLKSFDIKFLNSYYLTISVTFPNTYKISNEVNRPIV